MVACLRPNQAMTAPVVRLVTRLNVGGPARQALLLTRALADEFPTVLAAGRPAPAEGELSDPEVPVRFVPLTRAVRPLSDLAAMNAVSRLLRDTRAGLLHTHMAKAGTIGRLSAFRLATRPRTVHTFHGHVLEGYFSRPSQRAFVEIERWLARRTDVLLAVSPQIRDALLDLRIGHPSQFHIMPVGLDLTPFLAVDGPSTAFRAELGLGADVGLIGTVGRLVPIKDHTTLLRALEYLPSVHLAVVGDGELRRQLEAAAINRRLERRVHFVGWRHDLPSVLADLDAVVLTSRNEGTPVALIEALAACRPVVATDVGGVRHVVDDGRTGLLAPAGDDRAIAARLRDVLGDPSRAARMGRAGRAHVVACFGQGRLVDETRELYRSLLARPRVRPL